jgi:Subtilase family
MTRATRTALRASGAAIAHRRILAPAESMNAVTVGALHSDNFAPGALPASTFDIWLNTGLCTVSSALGPGIGNSVKPDVLAPGGRHHVRLLPAGVGHCLRPMGKNSSVFGGIVVAAPPGPPNFNPDGTSRTVGTSVAAAIMTGIASRAHEALEGAYDDFLEIPGPQRAVLRHFWFTALAGRPPGTLSLKFLGRPTTSNLFGKRIMSAVMSVTALSTPIWCSTVRMTAPRFGPLATCRRGSLTPSRCRSRP